MPKRRNPASYSLDPTNERFISGLHHYCDPSHRCLKFVHTEHLCGVDAATRDGQAQTVFDALSRVLEEARRELEKSELKHGDLDEDAVRASIAVEKRLQRRAARTGARET